MKFFCIFIFIFSITYQTFATTDSVFSFRYKNNITITVDFPSSFNKNKTTQIIFYALPNGNTTAQTMGKIFKEGDDWHFNIQHIAAQTKFIRNKIITENIVVVYLENDLKAWPSWKKQHTNYTEIIPTIIDTVIQTLHLKKYYLHLNGHSGGGAFIFGYLQAFQQIPSAVKRISFLDSDYGYDSTYTTKFINWLSSNKQNHLSVFAYNDSVVMYNGKPLVSPTGGTWYRSKLMMKDLSKKFQFTKIRNDSVLQFSALNNRINFLLIDNPEKKIFHTTQVERNGFIHSVLLGTQFENVGYNYWAERAYMQFIK
ncbi:MAG: hypothetical protein JSR09_07375 [Bacteroidetes bacterium]|nr:hypothetical protein [Bacteroidota bacterium]MBS1649515.1 hypothetical protein [Bacteroidota bacterium]